MSPHTLTVNGEVRAFDAPLSLRAVVAQLTGREIRPDGTAADGGRLGVAVAVDEAVVPRSRWDAIVPEAGARLEIVTAVQGG
ncbi:sulfur carrier protein ThiS [Micrococcus sp. M4NT]|uniref:sulfur carrier protein ThiS n=1 Tax=Micrococcus sp. M4NT TaxID=2957501 RepID=UPI0029AAA15D|nr:sulfur carrier protein ThiS [Micrococcus sp. M4NT]MDX2341318.1 sulfur carrier protein ThiS [Micrococcus sp. M4NT]